MPEFDPETIPTLDDIIEPVVPEVSDSETSDNHVESIIVKNESVDLSSNNITS